MSSSTLKLGYPKAPVHNFDIIHPPWSNWEPTMSSALLRTTPVVRAGLRAAKPMAMASTSFVRGKATLPDLPYDYAALEPYVSGQIMELHHSKHHQTYVNSFNAATEALAEALSKNDTKAAAAQAPLLNFHGGGHVNHSLFWENLAPSGKGGGGEPEGKLLTAINEDFGSFDNLKKQTNAALGGIQGSGWAWLVKDKTSGTLSLVTRANQDPVTGNFEPLLGIDAWEHAYYLQYQNRKAEYFSAIWEVINWGTVSKRFEK
ncbi:Superoxide dismutase [Mn], mitochondrial, variant 2 [Metarhizium acridum]|nr:Superoxide dismutase [Mn], mitochondrial, variant 2 [Metarhizium acridum]